MSANGSVPRQSGSTRSDLLNPTTNMTLAQIYNLALQASRTTFLRDISIGDFVGKSIQSIIAILLRYLGLDPYSTDITKNLYKIARSIKYNTKLVFERCSFELDLLIRVGVKMVPNGSQSSCLQSVTSDINKD